MSWRFNVCNPCCGCCRDGLDNAEWDVNVPATFADGIITNASSLNGLQVFPATALGSCVHGNRAFTLPGNLNKSQMNILISGCHGAIGSGTLLGINYSASISTHKAGDVIQFRYMPFSLSSDPNYVNPVATLSYTIAQDGCVFGLICGALAGNVARTGERSVNDLTWSEGLWILDGLSPEDIVLGKEFTLPNRGIDGAGLSTPFVCVDGFPGKCNYVCEFGPLLTGGFTASDAKVTLQP